MAIDALPEITEVKDTLDGGRQVFRCRVVARRAGAVVVLFVLERARWVGGLDLPAGTITFGHFWADRGYNVYHWMSPAGATLGHYFNVADRTVIEADRLAFRDLCVDVLVTPGGHAVLDEHELPAGLDPATRAQVTATLAELADPAPIVAEVEAAASELWPRAFGGAR